MNEDGSGNRADPETSMHRGVNILYGVGKPLATWLEGNIMDENNKIAVWEQRIRTAWDEEEQVVFSIIDAVEILTESAEPAAIERSETKLKKRQSNVRKYRTVEDDGNWWKKRLTDVANAEQLLRIIQSIPSPKAEPFKMWLAQVGREELTKPSDQSTIDRALATYMHKGYPREWINQRLQAIQVRKELTRVC